MIDIKKVDAIVIDIQLFTIEVLDHNTFKLWEQQYSTKEAMMKVAKKMLSKFDEELARRANTRVS